MPTISDMNRYAQRAFIPEEIQNTEVVVLNRLDWSLTTFTPLHFSSYFVSEGVLFHEDRMKGRELVDKVLKYVKRYIDFLLTSLPAGLLISKIFSFANGRGYYHGLEKGPFYPPTVAERAGDPYRV